MVIREDSSDVSFEDSDPLLKTTSVDEADKLQKKKSGVVLLAVISITFITLFSTQTVSIKALNYIYDIKLAWLTCVVLTIAWPVNMLLYGVERLRSKGTKAFVPKINKIILLKYCSLGFLDAIHMSLLSLAVTVLAGSTYMILKTTSILFNLFLSRIILDKKINVYHAFAIFFMSGSTVLVAMNSKKDAPDGVSHTRYMLGIAQAVGSAFGDALHTVLSDILLKDVKKNKSVLTVAQTASFNGMFSFFFVLPFAFVSMEWKDWPSTFSDAKDDNNLYYVIGLLAIVGLTKQFGYVLKFACVALSNAMFAGVVDLIRRMVVIIATTLLFNEFFGPMKAFAVFLTIVGFFLYVQGKGIVRTPETKPLLNSPAVNV